ncbi:MAG: hypothetical protein GWM98_23565, partial [Nitrospinaceae bacterium]|nr:hypothetical protein [Nitrospinaceae bacterium]NIR56892.1 hypothetical protein [Nitrospinaceae bacterium]NIS87353.1 hypothetical protein [Nitrospinaceae bacterium]NIT84209.1 hypothetical protein [Nitrospinaceae bacterium]NIU46393.1 hypothetical protein [Nitrospinaceae bacterium]
MKNILLILGIAVIGWFCWMPVQGYAELNETEIKLVQEHKQNLMDDLAEKRKEKEKWENMGKYSMFLVVLVIILGAVSSGINNMTFKGSKALVTIIGIVISVSTGVNNMLFSADFKSYERAAREYNSKIEGVERAVQRGLVFNSLEDFQDWALDIDEQIEGLNEYFNNIDPERKKDKFESGDDDDEVWLWTAVAYADPPWRNRRRDRRYYWYEGTGNDVRLRVAHEKSLKKARSNAKRKLKNFLRNQINNPVTLERAAARLAERARVA